MRGRSDGAALARQYLDALRHQRRLSPATLTNYGHALEALFKLLKDGELASLDATQVRRFVAVMHSRGLGPRSLALMLSAWRGFYHWLVRHHGYGANPAVGEVGEAEHVPELRLETVFPAEAHDAVVAALRAAHPYEEPAFDVYALL